VSATAGDIIYLDNNATTRTAPEAVEAMLPFLSEFYGNPSSVHRFGQRSRQAMDHARGQVARLIGAREADLLFTAGGTESINTAVRSMFAQRSPRRKVVTSTVEHSATRELCAAMAGEGAEIVRLGVDRRGQIDLGELESVLGDDVAVVTLIWANNETGTILPARRIAELCAARGVPLHLDATQAVGKIAVDVKDLGADAMSFASHKFHGPKGVGALYARRGIRIRPLMIGGPQERGRRGGTENVVGVVGMGAAAEIAAARLGGQRHVAELRNRLECALLTSVRDTSVNGDPIDRLPNTSNLSFARLEAEAILLLLSERGICASAGAACSSGSLEASPILLAMGIEAAVAHGAVRFSLSRYTTEAEVDAALREIPPVIARLREVLPM
jgi:cysteine desulfurase